MKNIQQLIAKRRSEKGATVIEYALIAALISVAAIVAFQTLGSSVNTTMGEVDTALQG